MAQEKTVFLQRVPLFEGLGREHLISLAGLLVERSFARGETIFFEDDPGEAMYIVRTGHIKVYRLADDGREKTLALMGPGDFFGEMALLDGEPRSAIAQALVQSSLYSLHRADFRKLITSNPAMSLEIIKVLSRRLRQSNAQIMDIIFRDVRGRVSKTLLTLAEERGVPVADGLKIDMKLTHQELANLVGTARETVSRILAELQDAGTLRLEGRHLVLLDDVQLEQFAAGL